MSTPTRMNRRRFIQLGLAGLASVPTASVVVRHASAADADAPLVDDHSLANGFLGTLPFALTGAQERVIEEIVEAGYGRAQVEHVTRLVDRNEYKRRQAPPGIKITRRAYGRDRRYPIVNRF